MSIDDIVRLNPGSDKQIRVGEALKIPQANSSSSSKNGRFHTIQAGETLYQLTVKYNISAQAICDANPGLSASNF
ncbi:LysM peptidoglycan-binding domain-containing protein, partial [Escherichia coli]|uniref:LysM peptidoglycan-binding domain-containing protein n=1 Tax=Escherichia coli TaxID=562 RepID=UPI0039E0FB38